MQTINEQLERPSERSFLFGSFHLYPAQQLLVEGDRPVAIGARALSILIALVERAGEVVSKDALVRLVWPETFVEESNLRVHVAGLRRALRDGEAGHRFVVNVPGRGYSFVAAVRVLGAPAPDPGPAAPAAPPISLPQTLTRIIGRAGVVEALCAHLAQRRFVTLVGPGGIGKTTVAIAVARALAPQYQDGVGFIDFSPLRKPQMVPAALAEMLGLAVPSAHAVPAVLSFLRNRQMLLVLDSCEHVVETVATAAEEISSTVPGVHILATSREPLRAAGERVHRLSALESPSDSQGLTAAQAMAFPCIQLLVERAAATLDDFELTDADAPIAADICRRLDGIALAIELAAGRVAAFGLRELLARLDDRFELLTSGRRTALPRHQTLAATLDWSYELLPEPERRLLRRMAVFAGDFTFAAAASLCDDGDETSPIAAGIADLVAKSLVVADFTATPVRYRLLDTTRLYGLEKLRRGGELAAVQRLHARSLSDLFAGAETACETMKLAEWLATYASQLENLRAALDWASSPDGDSQLCVDLTIGAVPLWVQLSLMSECRSRVEHALGLLDTEDAATRQAQMRLNAAWGWALMYSAGRSQDIGTAWRTTYDLAEQLGDTSYRLRGLWGIWISHVNKGDFAQALTCAHQLLELVSDSTDDLDLMMADRLMATTLHYRGTQDQARLYMDRMLNRYAASGCQPRMARFQIDQRVTAHYFKTRILWLQGYADQAQQLIEANLREGQALGHALSFSSVLGQGACPIALFIGNLDSAARLGGLLRDHADKHGLRLWHQWARCFLGLVAVRRGETAAGLEEMRAAFEQAGETRLLPRYMVLLGEYALCLGQAGQLGPGLATIEGILARCEVSQERWYVPEALRIQGELLAARATPGDAEAAQVCFREAVALAEQQDALSWRLRAATSLAHLLRDRGESHPQRRAALEMLQTVLARFTEGFDTSDLRTARNVLAASGLNVTGPVG